MENQNGDSSNDGESNFLMQRRMQALALRKGIDLLGVDLENEDHKQYVYHQLGFSAVVPQQIQLLACIKQYQEAALESKQQRHLCSLLGIQEAKRQEFDTYDQIVAYFEDCFFGADGGLQHLPRQAHWEQSPSSSLSVKVAKLPLQHRNQEPDMLRAPLPEGTSDGRSNRLYAVLTSLCPRAKHVFAAAATGAGKTRLCYDVAKEEFACYFDLLGGNGKVKQMDVASFLAQCEHVVEDKEPQQQKNSIQHTGVVLDHLVASLFASRWIAFGVALRTFPDMRPADWLTLQTDNPNLGETCYRRCVELKVGCLEKLIAILRHQEQLPLLLLDEAQALLRVQYHHTEGPSSAASIGSALVAWLNKNNLVGLFSGSSLRLAREFSPPRTGDSVMGDTSSEVLYDFDFLKVPDIKHVLEHFFDTSEEPELEPALALLQGRPLFVASAVQQILLDHGTTDAQGACCTSPRSIVQSIVSYTNRQILHPRSTVRSHWDNVFQQRVLAGKGVASLWSLALVLLTNNLFTYSSDEASALITRPFKDDSSTELASSGLTVIQKKANDGGRREVLAEPMVLSAGVTFCCTNPDINMEDLLVKLLLLTNPKKERQRHDKLLKLQLAVQVFQVHEELLRSTDWPVGVNFDTTQRPFGILVGVPLDDPRLSETTTLGDENKGLYWMALPDSPDGPDMVCPKTLFSMATTAGASSSAVDYVAPEAEEEETDKKEQASSKSVSEMPTAVTMGIDDSRTDASIPERFGWIPSPRSDPQSEGCGKKGITRFSGRKMRLSLPKIFRGGQ